MDMPDARQDALTSVAPDVTGVCIGWRSWKPVDTPAGWRLASPLRPGVVWPPDAALTARCMGSRTMDHVVAPVPDPRCSCGLYAVRDPTDVVTRGDDTLVGCVALWGRVVEGERGWRASQGFPLLLLSPSRVHAGLGRELAETYGVPVFFFRPGPESLTRIGDERVRKLAAAVRRHADVPGPALGQRVAELTDAVTAVIAATRWARSIGVGIRILDAALVLAVLASLLLTAAVVPPLPRDVLPGVTTIVDSVRWWVAALGWTGAVLLAAARHGLVAASLRTVRRRNMRSESRPFFPGFMAIWLLVAWAMPSAGALVEALRETMAPSVTLSASVTNCRDVVDTDGRRAACVLSWTFAGKTFRRDVTSTWLSDPPHVTVFVANPSREVDTFRVNTHLPLGIVCLLVAAVIAPAIMRYRAPRSTFCGTAHPSGADQIKVSAADAWLAAHGALSPARCDRISRRAAVWLWEDL
jgi:hypothetical protein